MTRTVEEDLRNPGLVRLLATAREKFEAVGGPRGRVRLETLQPHEAEAIDAIWKRSARRRPRRGQPFSCTLRDLEHSLLAMFGLTLEETLCRTGGPLRLRPQERADQAARLAAFWEAALAHDLCLREPRVRTWVEGLRGSGALGGSPFATDRGRSLAISLDIGATFPREPAIERSTLANEILGDPHGLDDGSLAGQRLIAQLAAREGLAGTRLTAGERRALLGRFGVVSDPASATVLVLGLRPVGDSPLEQALRLLAGGHVVVTLGQLARMPVRFERDLLVRLCENPAVVLRAEDRLGATCGPLVCTGGWPGSAVCALLDALREAGARFVHHGDFDWEGVAIGRWLRERYGARSWRFDAAAYRTAVAAAEARLPPLKASRHACDDDDLAVELRRCGVAVSEEAVLDELVLDLDVSGRDPLVIGAAMT